jgi:hypothetical protein
MLRCFALIALLLWPVNVTGRNLEAAPQRRDAHLSERTKQEARAVLISVLRDDRIEPTPCRFQVRWSSRPVAVDLAQAYLGSRIYADLVAPDIGLGPGDLIDSKGAMRGSFCNDLEASALWKQLQDDFRSGANPGARDIYDGKPNGPPRLRFERTEITLPVFDRRFTTAAVVVSFHQVMLWRTEIEGAHTRPQLFDAAGYLRRARPEGAGYTYIYRKRAGRWARVHQYQDWTLH